MKTLLSLTFLTAFPLVPAQAQQFEDLAALDAKVASALGSGSAAAIDRRLKLARCPEPVALDTASTDIVVLRCHPIGWRIRVPVNSRSGIVDADKILVRRGETVEVIFLAEDFEIASSGIASEAGFAGKRISVKSSTGGTMIVGTVVSEGVVHVND